MLLSSRASPGDSLVMRTGGKAFLRCGLLLKKGGPCLRMSAVCREVESPGLLCGGGAKKLEVFAGEELRLQARHLVSSTTVRQSGSDTAT